MPIYEYFCNKCKRKFEILQKITDVPKTRCPECKGKLEKVISQSSFHLKGAGWFKTVSPPKDSISECTSPESSKSCGGNSCSPKKKKKALTS